MIPTQCFDTVVGAEREWNSDDDSNLVYMLRYEYSDNNVDTDEILCLLSDWYAEYCIDAHSYPRREKNSKPQRGKMQFHMNE